MNQQAAKRYYYKDHLGSTRAVVNASGTVLQATDYYPFGLIMDGRSYLSGSPAKEGFTGKERDDETGFDYFGARTYSSELGRFIQVDPLADEFPGWSTYSYTFNNPLRFTDPTGMAPIDDYALNRETGELTLIRETDDEHDRIVQTDKGGNVKRKGDGPLGFLVRKSERGKAKVAIDGIEKGILKDGLNLQENNGNFAVNGEGQASLKGLDRFISEFSDYVGTEIAGVRLGPENSADISRVLTYKYGTKYHSRTRSAVPKAWFSQFGGLLKAHFHTHPGGNHTPSLTHDIPLRNRYSNLSFFIIAGGYAKGY